jgi:hypothetical protein
MVYFPANELQSCKQRVLRRHRRLRGRKSVPENPPTVSSGSELVAHPAFHEIAVMGTPVIPRVLREKENRTGHWHWALREITGADPVSPAERGRESFAYYIEERGWS